MMTTPNAAVSRVLKQLHFPLDVMLACVRLYLREAVPRDVKVQLCWQIDPRSPQQFGRRVTG